MKLSIVITQLQHGIQAPIIRQPVFRLVICSFILVTIFPLAVLSVRLYDAAWDNAWREVIEKHQLLAESITLPISIFIDDNRRMLSLVANSISHKNATVDDFRIEHTWLNRALDNIDDFTGLALLDMQGQLRVVAIEQGVNTMPVDDTELASLPVFSDTRIYGTSFISNIELSPITGKPGLFISQPVYTNDGKQNGVLIGELKLDLIERVRQRIHFGENGNTTIVDAIGQIVAHPNQEWVNQIRDVSAQEIVQRINAGEIGTLEYTSLQSEEIMIAGYARVPDLGWGIIVSQPKQEIADQVNNLLKSYLLWGAIGLSIAMFVAYVISRWITGPINNLAAAASELDRHHNGVMPEPPEVAPKEIHQLAVVMKNLFDGLQNAGSEIQHLNDNLQQQVESATMELSTANHRLRFLAERDYLTNLSNRRHFESELSKKISEGHINSLCIMLIDIDNFKSINDRYGHAAGDEVLTGLGEMLAHLMRPGDLLARYGGDEFVGHMECDLDTAEQRARNIRNHVENTEFEWQGHIIKTTISIGLFVHNANKAITLDKLLDTADIAMYRSKNQGRNLVTVIRDVA